MSLIMSILQPLLAMLGAKFGVIGVIGAYALAFVPVMTVLIELLQFIVSLTNNAADEAVAAKVNDIWENYVLPVLEVLPHVNLPLSATAMAIIGYVMKAVAAIQGAIQGWLNPPPPPSPPAPPASGS